MKGSVRATQVDEVAVIQRSRDLIENIEGEGIQAWRERRHCREQRDERRALSYRSVWRVKGGLMKVGPVEPPSKLSSNRLCAEPRRFPSHASLKCGARAGLGAGMRLCSAGSGVALTPTYCTRRMLRMWLETNIATCSSLAKKNHEKEYKTITERGNPVLLGPPVVVPGSHGTAPRLPSLIGPVILSLPTNYTTLCLHPRAHWTPGTRNLEANQATALPGTLLFSLRLRL